MTLLQASNLRISIGRQEIIRGVDVIVDRGEVVGLIGPNGAGKTTLLRALAGLAPASEGTIAIEGKPREALDRAVLGRRIAYLPQGAPCHWPLTVAAQVSLGRIPHKSPWQRLLPDDEAAVFRAMEATDVRHLANRTIPTLSGGERARAMLARAFATEPDILLADEPVAALDPAHQLRVMGVIASLAGKGGGVVVVVHDLSLAARFCDRLVLLSGGEVFAEGAPPAVLTPETLADVYGIETEIEMRRDGLAIYHRLPDSTAGDKSWH